MTPVKAPGDEKWQTYLMIAQLRPDKMPLPPQEGVRQFQRLFCEAAGLSLDKADLPQFAF
ncbi:hypothetical protein BKD09_15510 [Bradyrhizobium japonicum]|uniref:Uncharacterized protein n=1 Tax=Bradyrhizobium japonicum TaxID=375 RepID=A0A1L3F8U7_BRAJP|nr:hypothetical protein [Bradyrhizobium japonicum]APG09746.1 hypothetical protein BKD09_15510 [Bradyrhizobium japonicum]